MLIKVKKLKKQINKVQKENKAKQWKLKSVLYALLTEPVPQMMAVSGDDE